MDQREKINRLNAIRVVCLQLLKDSIDLGELDLSSKLLEASKIVSGSVMTIESEMKYAQKPQAVLKINGREPGQGPTDTERESIKDALRSTKSKQYNSVLREYQQNGCMHEWKKSKGRAGYDQYECAICDRKEFNPSGDLLGMILRRIEEIKDVYAAHDAKVANHVCDFSVKGKNKQPICCVCGKEKPEHVCQYTIETYPAQCVCGKSNPEEKIEQ